MARHSMENILGVATQDGCWRFLEGASAVGASWSIAAQPLANACMIMCGKDEFRMVVLTQVACSFLRSGRITVVRVRREGPHDLGRS